MYIVHMTGQGCYRIPFPRVNTKFGCHRPHYLFIVIVICIMLKEGSSNIYNEGADHWPICKALQYTRLDEMREWTWQRVFTTISCFDCGREHHFPLGCLSKTKCPLGTARVSTRALNELSRRFQYVCRLQSTKGTYKGLFLLKTLH